MNEFNRALLRIHDLDFEYGHGLTNHAPMAVEALHVLGHDALIDAFLDAYLPRLRLIGEGSLIPLKEQASALGCRSPEDWLETLCAESEHTNWKDLLRRHLPRLMPGAFAAAMHGPIRLAHAVRALEEEESSERQRELTSGLAYWAACFHALPGRVGCEPEAGRGPARVLEELEAIPRKQGHTGLISEAARRVEGHPGFLSAMTRADLESELPANFLSDLAGEAAGLYLRNPDNRIAYLHGVTGVSALRLLVPYLEEGFIKESLGVALECVATLHAVYGDSTPSVAPGPELLRLAESWDEMRYRAACSLEEHVIKLTEACWREDRIRRDDRFRMAAADVILALGPSSRTARG